MRRDLIEAHALTRRAEQLWPLAHTNMIELQAGYPTGPSDNTRACPCRGECYCPCPTCACDTRLTPTEAAALTNDQARTALRTVEASIGRCVAVCCELLDIRPTDSGWRYMNAVRATQHRIHLAGSLLDVCAKLELTPLAAPDTHRAYRHARTIHDTITAWAFTPTQQRADSKATTDQWCRHHLALLQDCVPVYRAGLCAWCYSFQATQRRGLPAIELLAAHHDGRRVTQTMIDKHQPKPKKRRAA